MGGHAPEADFGTTSRLVRRKPPMRSSVRFRITSGLLVIQEPTIRHLGHPRCLYAEGGCPVLRGGTLVALAPEVVPGGNYLIVSLIPRGVQR
jgi:hypothetical protein